MNSHPQSATSSAAPSWIASGFWSKAFAVLLCVYWLVAVFVDSGDTLGQRGWQYVVTVTPICVFCVLCAPLAPRFFDVHRLPPAVALLVGGCILVGLLSASRGDLMGAIHFLTLCVPVAVVIATGLRVSLALVNALFLLSIASSIYGYFEGSNIYGFLPGQALVYGSNELWWRISLFNRLSPPAGSFVALLVLGANLVGQTTAAQRPARMMMIALASYFLILTGCRTAIVAMLYVMVHVLVSKLLPRTRLWILPLFVASLVTVTVYLTLAPSLISQVESQSDFLNTFIFRTINPSFDVEELRKGLVRGDIWLYHLSSFADSPLFGQSQAVLEAGWTLASDGGESYMTFLMARYGIGALVVLAAFALLYWQGLARGDDLKAIAAVAIVVFMLFYGSFIKTFCFPFLLALGLINMPGPFLFPWEWSSRRKSTPHARPAAATTAGIGRASYSTH